MFRLAKFTRLLLALLGLLLVACSGGNTKTQAQPAEVVEVANANPEAAAEVVQEAADPVRDAPEVVDPAQDAPQQTDENGLPLNADGVAVVARVNGTDITLPTLQRELQRREAEASFAEPTALQTSVLDTLIEQELIEQAAVAQNVSVTDEEIDAELQASVELAGGEEAWQQWLSENNYTADEFRQTLYSTLLTAKIRDAVVEPIGDTTLQANARHILVGSLEEAQQVLARLQAGEDFAALAAELSNDVTTRDQGGDLGWFARGELLQPSLAEVAFTLEPGQVSQPIQTLLGFHIVQVMGREEREVTPMMRYNLAQLQFEEWLQGIFSESIIERYL